MANKPTNLADAFTELVEAGQTAILVKSLEPSDALAEIRDVCRKPHNQWPLMTFDLDLGSRLDVLINNRWVSVPCHWKAPPEAGGDSRSDKESLDPAVVIRNMGHLNHGLQKEVDGEMLPVPGVLIMKNHQRWLNSPQLVQILENSVTKFKPCSLYIVLLSPTSELPLELRRLFETGHIKHNLPDREQVRKILHSTVPEEMAELSEEQEERVLDASSGMTRLGVEAAAALSVYRYETVDPEVLFDLKAEALGESMSSLEIYRGDLTLDAYGGAHFLKQFCLELLAKRHEDPKMRPRGVFMLGPPGVGKTMLAKCLGSAVNRATALVTLGALRSKYQGESFENLLHLLEILEAMSPLIAFFDEVEGQVSGGKHTGSMDAGTGSQINSKLLSWMSDRPDHADIFLMAACNDIRALMQEMPEFARVGRFDGLFFIDYPGRQSKDEIWKIHLQRYGLLKVEDKGATVDELFKEIALPKDDMWTGSEIEACCRLAAVRGKTLPEIGDSMPVISNQAAERIEETREWADGRCYAAEYDGIYRKDQHKATLSQLASTNGHRRQVLRSSKRKTKEG